MKKTILASLIALMLVASANADIVWDEADDGDLSNDHLNPTVVTLANNTEGVSKVIASTTFDPLDRDFLTIRVPNGSRLVQILWGLYDTTEDQSWFAVEAGTQVTDINSAENLLGSMLVNPSHVATDVLDDLGQAQLGGIGFTGSLGPGDYTFWFQETEANVNYGYTFIVNQVPEPSLGLVPMIVGLVCLAHRRRKA